MGFFADPEVIPWDEEESSKDVVHLFTENVKLLP
jgi:hypothetical protein